MNANKSFLRRRFLAFWVDWLCLALLILPLVLVTRAFARSVAAAVVIMVVIFGLLGLFIFRDRLHRQALTCKSLSIPPQVLINHLKRSVP